MYKFYVYYTYLFVRIKTFIHEKTIVSFSNICYNVSV